MNAGTGIAVAVGLGVLALAAASGAKGGIKPPPGGSPDDPGALPETMPVPPPVPGPQPLPDFPGLPPDVAIAFTELFTFASIVPDDVKITSVQLLVKYPQVLSTTGLDNFIGELYTMSDDVRAGYYHAATSNDITELQTAAAMAAMGFPQASAQLSAIAQFIAAGNITPLLASMVRALAETGIAP